MIEGEGDSDISSKKQTNEEGSGWEEDSVNNPSAGEAEIARLVEPAGKAAWPRKLLTLRETLSQNEGKG